MPLPSLIDEIDRLFDELVRRPWGSALRHLSPAEVRTVDDGWVVELPVEGLEAGDLEVEVQGNRLTVFGHRSSQPERRKGRRGVTRTQQLSLQRSVTLPVAAEPDDIEASVEGSTLTIHIRKRDPWRKLIRSNQK
jgi:HSP20 family molecular chaperone IbpA